MSHIFRLTWGRLRPRQAPPPVGAEPADPPGHRFGEWRRWMLPTIVLVSGLLISGTTSYRLQVDETRRAHAILEQVTDQQAMRVERELRDHLHLVEAIRTLYDSSQFVDRREFELFCEAQRQRHPSLLALAWAPRVTVAERAEHEAAGRAEWFDSYTVVERIGPGQMATASEQAEYFPAYYINSNTGSPRARGFDISSEPTRREALERARATGATALSSPVDLVGPRPQRGLLAITPVFASEPATGDEPAEVQGVVIGVLGVDSLIANALPGELFESVAITIRDQAPTPGSPIIFASSSRPQTDWRVTRHFDLAGRHWQIDGVATAAFVRQHQTGQPWVVALGGSALSIMLALLLALARGRTERVRLQVEQRTTQLSRANRSLAAEVRQRVKAERKLQGRSREVVRVNRRLAEKNKELRALSETAHRFVDNVAHEFRTPLTVVREFTKIIEDELGGPITDEQRSYLGFITTATDELAEMVDDFLDSSKLKHGTLRVDRRVQTWSQVIASVEPILSQRALAKGVSLELDPANGGLQVFCDRAKAGRVIINLVVNAIRFSTPGSVVSVSTKRDAGRLWVQVTDSGPGIDPGDLQVLGSRFQQLGDPHKTSAKGFGLGLNIAKELAWLNLGRLTVRSEVGRGSTFAFSLPVWSPAVLEQYVQAVRSTRVLCPATVVRLRAPDDAMQEKLYQQLVRRTHAMDLVLPMNGGGLLVIVPRPDAREWLAGLGTQQADERPAKEVMELLGSVGRGRRYQITELPGVCGRAFGTGGRELADAA